MNQLDNDTLTHILARLSKEDVSSLCCTAQDTLDENTYMELFKRHYFEKLNISSWKSAFHSLNNIVTTEELHIYRIYERFLGCIERFLEEDSEGKCEYDEGYYLHGYVDCMGLSMNIYEPQYSEFSWDGNDHPAKYEIRTLRSRNDPFSFDMDLPKHTILSSAEWSPERED